MLRNLGEPVMILIQPWIPCAADSAAFAAVLWPLKQSCVMTRGGPWSARARQSAFPRQTGRVAGLQLTISDSGRANKFCIKHSGRFGK